MLLKTKKFYNKTEIVKKEKQFKGQQSEHAGEWGWNRISNILKKILCGVCKVTLFL